MGVPEIVQLAGERTRPAGRLMFDVNSHDAISVPPEQSISMGEIVWPRAEDMKDFGTMLLG